MTQKKPSPKVPCKYCGVLFHSKGMWRHERACSGQGLPKDVKWNFHGSNICLFYL